MDFVPSVTVLRIMALSRQRREELGRGCLVALVLFQVAPALISLLLQNGDARQVPSREVAGPVCGWVDEWGYWEEETAEKLLTTPELISPLLLPNSLLFPCPCTCDPSHQHVNLAMVTDHPQLCSLT